MGIFSSLGGMMDMDSMLQMAKKIFVDEKLKSIVVYLDENETVKFEKYKSDVIAEMKDLLANCPEALEYMKNKAKNK